MRQTLLRLALLALAFFSTAEMGMVTVFDHMEEVNTLLCEAMEREGVGGKKGDCERELNHFAIMNRGNASLFIDPQRSYDCLNRLRKKTGSAEILAASVRGICSFESLRIR